MSGCSCCKFCNATFTCCLRIQRTCTRCVCRKRLGRLELWLASDWCPGKSLPKSSRKFVRPALGLNDLPSPMHTSCCVWRPLVQGQAARTNRGIGFCTPFAGSTSWTYCLRKSSFNYFKQDPQTRSNYSTLAVWSRWDQSYLFMA